MKIIPANPGGPWNPRPPSAAIAAIGAAADLGWTYDVVIADVAVRRMEAARLRALSASAAARAAKLAADR